LRPEKHAENQDGEETGSMHNCSAVFEIKVYRKKNGMAEAIPFVR